MTGVSMTSKSTMPLARSPATFFITTWYPPSSLSVIFFSRSMLLLVSGISTPSFCHWKVNGVAPTTATLNMIMLSGHTRTSAFSEALESSRPGRVASTSPVGLPSSSLQLGTGKKTAPSSPGSPSSPGGISTPSSFGFGGSFTSSSALMLLASPWSFLTTTQ